MNTPAASKLDSARAREAAKRSWKTALPALIEYMRIPNKSPGFDAAWRENGHMDRAVALVERYCREHAPPGMTIEVVRLEGRTPVLFLEWPGDSADTVLLYGHVDKQPEMTGWSEGLGPWTPVLRDDRLYGRGGADDGYAAFATIAALTALHEQGVRRPRCVVLIEACEESGSYDLPHYVEALAPRIGKPSLVVCLDSGCGNYEQLWCTASLRGLVSGTLRADVLDEGVHSGEAGGIVPSSFLVLRQLLARVEDTMTGAILVPDLHVDIPAERVEQARGVVAALGESVRTKFPLAGATRPLTDDLVEMLLNGTWRPSLATVGAAGLPAPADAGNVLRPFTSLKLSFRLPPTAEPGRAAEALKAALERDPPFGAKVRFDLGDFAAGWAAPPVASWLARSLAAASERHFGAPAVYMGEGGSIPFMAMLGKRYPEAQFLITGVLGPQSNAHGPNEFLHLPTAEKLSACVADVLADHALR